MVQPAVCYKGKWVSAGVVSQKAYPRILKEVKKLWQERRDLLFRDVNRAGVISEYDLDLKCLKRAMGDIRKLERRGEDSENEDEQEGEDFYFGGKADPRNN